MELYKGLPIRTIEAVNKQSIECIFGITTEIVETLINAYYTFEGLDKEVNEFDNSYMYAVPQNIFEMEDDKEVLKYINENIDDNYKLD